MPTAGRTLNRNLFLLWQGQLVSLLGTQVFRLALVVWLKQAAESATLLGLLMATFVVPGLFIGPFGGVIADRYPRRLVLIPGADHYTMVATGGELYRDTILDFLASTLRSASRAA